MTKLATRRHDWIDDVCVRFTHATGWPLVFTAVASDSDAAAAAGNVEHAWTCEVADDQQVKGILHLELPADAARDHQFTAVRELAEAFAELIAKNLTSASQLASRSREVSTLVDIGRSLPSEGDLLAGLRQLLRAAVELTDFRGAAFFLLGSSTSQLTLRAVEAIDAADVPFAERRLETAPPDLEALARGRVVLHRTSGAKDAAWLPASASSGLCLAVQSEAGPLGTIWVYDRRLRFPGERELHVLESIAVQVAAVLERVVLLRESAAKQRLQRDLQVASENEARGTLQRLPASLPYDIAAACTSRYELGGDLCEVIAVDQERTLIAVGDASGDSVPAALVMSAVRGALRAIASGPVEDVVHPERVLQKLNGMLYDVTPAHLFMSLLVGVLDAPGGTFTYSNGGHPLPIHVRHSTATLLHSHGMLLGVLRDSTYDFSVLPLAASDMLLLYSDGVSEAMDRRRRMFRSEGIIEAVRKHRSKSAHDIVQAIWAELDDHVGNSSFDDRTLMVVKIPD